MIDAVALSLSFHELAIIGIAVLKHLAALAIGLARRHFALVSAFHAHFLYRAGANGYFLGRDAQWQCQEIEI